LSGQAQDMFRALQARPSPPKVIVSTNSLAATDAFIAYALSFKYKRRYLREFGFHIYEFKPFPGERADRPGSDRRGRGGSQGAAMAIDERPRCTWMPRAGAPAAARTPATAPRPSRNPAAAGRTCRDPHYIRQRGRNAPVALLRRAGVRIGMHAKSLVIDERIGVVRDPQLRSPWRPLQHRERGGDRGSGRSRRALAESIRGDMRPENAWVIGRRDKAPVLSGLDYSLAKVSEQLPVFDLWPWKVRRRATSSSPARIVPSPCCATPPGSAVLSTGGPVSRGQRFTQGADDADLHRVRRRLGTDLVSVPTGRANIPAGRRLC
jgi:hypothetical protein